MKYKVACFSLCVIFGALLSCSIADALVEKDQKIYVSPAQVMLNDEMICVNIDDKVVMTNMLCKDTDGYYILASHILENKGDYECGGCYMEFDSLAAYRRHKEEYH